MRQDYSKYRNISLSVIIKRDLKKLKMTQKSLAALINMSYSQLNHLLNSSCKFPLIAEKKLEKILGYDPFFISNLRRIQAEIRKEEDFKQKEFIGQDIPSIRKCVFWDINTDNLDWSRHRRFIISRISQYGNDQEKKSVASFYNL